MEQVAAHLVEHFCANVLAKGALVLLLVFALLAAVPIFYALFVIRDFRGPIGDYSESFLSEYQAFYTAKHLTLWPLPHVVVMPVYLLVIGLLLLGVLAGLGMGWWAGRHHRRRAREAGGEEAGGEENADTPAKEETKAPVKDDTKEEFDGLLQSRDTYQMPSIDSHRTRVP